MEKTADQLIEKLEKFETELKLAMPGISREMGEVALSYTITQIRRNGGLLNNAQYSNRPGVPAYLYKGKTASYPRALNAAGRKYIDSKIKYKAKQDAISSKFKKELGEDGLTPTGKFRRGTFNPAKYAGFVSWKGLRDAQGLQTSKVDLTYTGRMLQNVSVIDIRVIGLVYQAVVGGKDKETVDKLRWNKARYGDFLKFTDIAFSLARKQADTRISALYAKIMNE